MLNWSNIDTVLLDMDGTLLDLHYDNYFWTTYLPQRYAEIKNIALTDAKRLLHDHIESLKGTLNWYCLDYWSDTLALDIGLLKTEIKGKIKERPHTLPFLKALQKHQKMVVLVTNAHPIGLELKLAETGIAPYLNHTVSSHQFKQPKESQEFWHHLHHFLPFDRTRTLFIDDSPSILKSAKEYGIHHVIGIHQPDSQIERRLQTETAISDFNEIMP